MEYKITGRIKDIMSLQGVSKSGNPWQKQVLRLEITDNAQYPDIVEITFWGTRTNLLGSLLSGEVVEVTFALHGREYNGRIYHSLSGLAINKPGQQPQAAPEPIRQATAPDMTTEMLYATTGHKVPGSRPLPDGVKSVGDLLTQSDTLPF